jgi:RNA ligase
MTINLKLFEEYIENGWLIRQHHPTLPLTIWNYSRVAQFEKKWDNITLMCRGLITEDVTGKIVARPLNKFFNYGEIDNNEIPNESFTLTEKLDGSLMIVFHYQGKWHIASRGSFTSNQAIWGNEILNESNTKALMSEWTYCMELIVPENRIVVDYGKSRKLIVITSIKTREGYEGSIRDLASQGWEIVKEYDGIMSLSQIKSMILDNQEGFVVKFESGFRIKVKGDEYVRLHGILTNISTKTIWEYLKSGESMSDILNNVPDEFDLWVKKTIETLKSSYSTIEDGAIKIFHEIKDNIESEDEKTDKKKFANLVMSQTSTIRPILFKIYDNKDYSNYIWKILEPKYEKPFIIITNQE